jgi:hypothetical protein
MFCVRRRAIDWHFSHDTGPRKQTTVYETSHFSRNDSTHSITTYLFESYGQLTRERVLS